MGKQVIFINALIIILAWGCSTEQNQSSETVQVNISQYTDKIRERVKKDASGLEMNYQSVSFEWFDTLYVRDVMNSIESLTVSLPDVESNKIFSDEFITKENLMTLRNWEDEQRGIPFDKEYKLYTDFAKANTEKSDWLKTLTVRIERTDSILENWDLENQNKVEIWALLIGYYKRIDGFYSSRQQMTDLWPQLEAKLQSIQDKSPNDVVSYRAINVFKINNPAFNGVEQELKQFFVFSPELEIIDRYSVE